MLDPNYLRTISEGAEEIASQLHGEIIKRIVDRMMLRIGRGEKYILTSVDKWNIQTLQDAGFLLEDIQIELAKATKVQQKEIAEAMEEAGVKALEYDDAIYSAAGLSPTPLVQSPELIRLMERNYKATLGEWNNFTRTTANASQQLFIREMDRAYHLVTSGVMSYTQAVKEVINAVAEEGVRVVYPSGRSDTLETATLRAVRTGVSQATGSIQMARMEEMEWDIVLTSAHLGARSGDGGQNPGNHVWWQGQFFSRTGRTPKYPLFAPSTGYGTVEGLCGANCRHSFGPGDGENNPFEDYLYEENAQAEKLQQKQRAKERDIRNLKREVMTLKEAIDKSGDEKLKFELDMEYQRKSALLQKKNAEYDAFCQENGLTPLKDRLQIAKWDRKQAAAARGAAKRYENSAKTLENTGKSSTIEAGKTSSIAMAKRIPDAKTKSKIINEAIDAKEPVYADNLRAVYKRIKPKDGCKDVAIHGTPHYLEYEGEYTIDAETLYYIVSGRREMQGENIRLLSCSTGMADKNGDCVAQELADRLGVDVYAPAGDLHIYPNGKLTVGRKELSEGEGFKWFHPRKEGGKE